MNCSSKLVLLLVVVGVGITGFSRGVSAEEGAADGIPEFLQSLYQGIRESNQTLQQNHPNAQIPPELQHWLERFSSAPFADDTVNSLNHVSQELRSNSSYSSSRLPEEKERLINDFVSLVRGISVDLTRSISGESTPDDSGSASQLGRLTAVHDTDQQWINEKGRELAELYQQLDFSGVVSTLQGVASELQQHQQTRK